MVCAKSCRETLIFFGLIAFVYLFLVVFKPPSLFNVIQFQLNRPPEIYSVTASPLSIKSGQFISFGAIADDPDRDPLTFLWDFGDGTTAEGKKVKHVFNLRPGQFSQSFKVRLTVTDSKGASASKETSVKVEKAFFLVKPITPEEHETFDKGSTLNLRVRLEDAEGRLIGSQNVYFVKARLKEREASLEPSEDYGVFEGKLSLPFELESQDYLVFEASAFAVRQPRFTNTLIQLNFSPVSLNAEIETVPEKIYDGNTLSAVHLYLTYADGSMVSRAEIQAKLDGIDLNFIQKDSYFEARNLGFVARKAARPRILLESVKDDYENSLTNYSIPLKFSLPEIEGLEKVEEIEELPEEIDQELEEKIKAIVERQAAEAPFDFVLENIVWIGAALLLGVMAIALLLFILRRLLTRRIEKIPPPVKPPAKEIKLVKPEKLIKPVKMTEKEIEKSIKELKLKFKKAIPKMKLTPKQRIEKLKNLLKEKSLKEKLLEKEKEELKELTEQELKSVNAMVALLKPYKKKYSPREVEEAAMAEGYSPKLARLIAKKLFEEK